MFTTVSGLEISNEEIGLIISSLLFEVIEKHTPHVWVSDSEPFINQYNGRISYDYSGYVEIMTVEDLKEIAKDAKSGDHAFYYEAELPYLISNVYINQWTASYISNHGKTWISYQDLLRDLYGDWKNDNFVLYEYEDYDVYDPSAFDYEKERLFEELDADLDEVLEDFFNHTPMDIYYMKILNSIKR